MAPIRRTPSLSVLLISMLVALTPNPVTGQQPSPATSDSPMLPPLSSPSGIVLEPVTETGYGITSVAPVGWTELGNGVRARGRSSEDQTLLALQSAPMGLEAIWPTLLQQLGLSAIPDPIETRSTDAGLDWGLYQAVPAPGFVADLGLTERDRVSYVVLLLATTDEAPALRDLVFLPAIDAFAPAVVPSPTANASRTEVEVSFPGGASDVVLAGTLTVPATPGQHPGVVLMSGSGPQDRDSRLPGIDLRIFALIADALAQQGIAVLRYDDRGTASSTGSYAGALIPDLTADGAAALAYLRTRPEIDPARTGLLGHSEGGVYAARIAADDPGVAFVVALAPAVGTGVEVIVEQNEAILRANGASAGALQLTRTSTPGIYEAALDGDMTHASQLARAYFEGLYDLSTPEEQALLGDRAAWVEAQVAELMATVDTDEFLSFLRTDPEADWRRVTAPTLGVFGELDVQVVADAEAPRLEAALASGDARSRVVVLPGANHMFQAARTGAVSEYAALPPEFTPGLLPLLTGWIRDVTGLAGGTPTPS